MASRQSEENTKNAKTSSYNFEYVNQLNSLRQFRTKRFQRHRKIEVIVRFTNIFNDVIKLARFWLLFTSQSLTRGISRLYSTNDAG